jgi:hypothetical protein
VRTSSRLARIAVAVAGALAGAMEPMIVARARAVEPD